MKKTKWNLFLFFILSLAGFFGFNYSCLAEENIIINEILIGGDSASEEFIELYNPTSSDIDLEKLPLKLHTINSKGADTNKTLRFINSEIKSHGFFLIASDDYQEKFGDLLAVDATYSASLVSNGAVYISTSSAKDTSVLDLVCWGLSSKCSLGLENITEYSLEKIDASSWQKSYVSGGTPGEKNSTKPAPKIYSDKIYISELLPNPSDQDEKKEFIELFNNSSAEIDLEGWILKDKTSSKYIFPKNNLIKAGEYLVIYSADYSFALNNSGKEEVMLLSPDEKIISFVAYSGTAKENYSYSFDGSKWKWTEFLTPGEENKFADYSGKISIVSLSPNPKGKDTKEWIEIKNGTKKEINLKNWSVATGWKKLSNHPIRKDFKIKPGKSKKLTRKICAFILNNSKNKIELRDPFGETVQKIKYNRKKDKIEEDEIYQKIGKKWNWDKSNTAVKISSTNSAKSINAPVVAPAPVISEEELKLEEDRKEIENNIGSFTPEENDKEDEEENNEDFSKIETPNHLALSNPVSAFSMPEGRVLGAYDIQEINSQYLFTPPIEQKHWAEVLWEEANAWINSFL